MQHRKIDEIKADMAKIANETKAIRASKEAAVEAFKRKQDEKFKDDETRLRHEAATLHDEYEQAKIAAASHPLEGKVVYREEEQRSRFKSYKFTTIRKRGIVTVLRDYKDFPQRKNNDRFAPMPELGDVIIQRIDAKGNKLKGWEKIYPDMGEGLPRNWKIEETADA